MDAAVRPEPDSSSSLKQEQRTRGPESFSSRADWERFPPEDVPVVVEGSCQSSRLRHGVQVGLQVLGRQPPAFPPNPGAAAGEQGLQGLEQRRHGSVVCFRKSWIGFIFGQPIFFYFAKMS